MRTGFGLFVFLVGALLQVIAFATDTPPAW
jgi:hypothetical protein